MIPHPTETAKEIKVDLIYLSQLCRQPELDLKYRLCQGAEEYGKHEEEIVTPLTHFASTSTEKGWEKQVLQ